MATPRLFLSRQGVNALLRAGEGYKDDGTVYDLALRSDRIAPAGRAGECIFTTLYLTTTHFDTNVSLVVTPFVDGVALASQTLALVGVVGSSGEVQRHEIALSVPYIRGGVERLRVAARGAWIEVAIATNSAATDLGPVEVHECVVEYEVVQESLAAIP